MSQIYFWLRKVILSCFWTTWVKLSRACDAFSDRRLCYFIDDLSTSLAKKFVEYMFIKITDKSPLSMKEFLLEYVCKSLQLLCDFLANVLTQITLSVFNDQK